MPKRMYQEWILWQVDSFLTANADIEGFYYYSLQALMDQFKNISDIGLEEYKDSNDS